MIRDRDLTARRSSADESAIPQGGNGAPITRLIRRGRVARPSKGWIVTGLILGSATLIFVILFGINVDGGAVWTWLRD